MEAVWRRFLLLLIAGVLLTMMLFPIVKGQEIIDEEKEEEKTNKIPTRIKCLYFDPVDRSDPQDGRPDLYRSDPEEWKFIFLLSEVISGNETGNPVPNTIMWLNVTMGSQINSTLGITDRRGRVMFHFTSEFTDSISGESLEGSRERTSNNMTITAYFPGNETYYRSLKKRYCTYHYFPIGGNHHRYVSKYEHYYLWVNLVIFATFDIYVIFFIPYREIKRLINKKKSKKFKIIHKG